MTNTPIRFTRRPFHPGRGALVGALHAAVCFGALLAPPSAIAQGCPNWSGLSPLNEPSPRIGHAMAYHEGSGRILLFSGASTGVLQNATWEYNGSTWLSVANALPSPRTGHAMAYDHLRGRVILFSGVSATQYENATWEWTGTTWSVRANTGPAPRAGHAMSSLSNGGQIILFGGANASQRFGDTWSWNGAAPAWTNITPSEGPSPSARSGHAMAYDSSRRVVVLFGGFSDNGFEGDTWEWSVDTSTWSQARDASTGPGPRSRVTMAYDEANARTILVADASTPTRFDSETWEWNGVAWTLLTGVSDGRTPGAMVYDSLRDRMTLFGGIAGDPSAIYFEVGGTTALSRTYWRLNMGSGPGARRQHAMSAHTTRDEIVLFGGLARIGSNDSLAGDTWLWTKDDDWGQVAVAGPSGRRASAMVEHAAMDGVLLFGGADATGQRADSWRWDGGAWTELAPATPPPVRAFHAMALTRPVTASFSSAAKTPACSATRGSGTARSGRSSSPRMRRARARSTSWRTTRARRASISTAARRTAPTV